MTTMKLRIADVTGIDGAVLLDQRLCWTAGERRSALADNRAAIDALIGDAFFVIRCAGERGRRDYILRHDPGRTNMSHEPRANGWLGNTDNTDYHALGRYTLVGRSATYLHLAAVAA